ncbi:MAG: hypothetical protein NVV63_16475 [Opitutus sp.]|nr:hypothetical protein [Opitutus sp.]
MRKVLIVSPHFAPVNAPDMHRVRLALPYLRELGWEPVVLCLDPATVEGAVFDPLLETTYPHDLRIVRVKGISPRATRWAGFGNLWLRVGRAFARAGERLLAAEKFDLVFISTTQFSAFGLGPRWKRRFGVPYVLDYQDPWINPYYRDTKTRPPGGRLKFALSQWTARRIEPQALREAGRVVLRLTRLQLHAGGKLSLVRSCARDGAAVWRSGGRFCCRTLPSPGGAAH